MRCFFCLEEKEPSLEHVFPEAIGGTLKTGRFVFLRQLCDRSVEPRYRFVEIPQLHHKRRRRLAHYKRNCFVAGLDQLSQFAGVPGPLRRDHADLGQVPAQAVQQLCETGNFSGVGYRLLCPAGRCPPLMIEEVTVTSTAAVEWKIAIEGTDAFGEVRRHEIRLDKSWDRLFDGEIGFSVEDGKRIMAALQTAVVRQEADAYALFRRVCPDCGVLRPVKDYTTRRIRTVFGTAEVRNPRWMLCRDCHPGFALPFAPLGEICPDRATPELMELTARLGSTMPYRQAASVMANFLPVEPTETHATVRKRTIRTGERLDHLAAEEERTASLQAKDRCQLELELPGDRRREFAISIDTAHIRSADPKSSRNFELVVARCGRGGRGEAGGRYFVTAGTDQYALRDRAIHALGQEGYRGFGDVAVISDGAEILSAYPERCRNPRPTSSTGFTSP